MRFHHDFFADRAKDEAALIACVDGDLPEDGITRALRLHREAAEKRSWRCRLCGKSSFVATCDDCLDEFGE